MQIYATEHELTHQHQKVNQDTDHAQVAPRPSTIRRHMQTYKHTHTHTNTFMHTCFDCAPLWRKLILYPSGVLFSGKYSEQCASCKRANPNYNHETHLSYEQLCSVKFTGSARNLLLFITQDKCLSLDIWFGAEGIYSEFKVQRSYFWVFSETYGPF